MTMDKPIHFGGRTLDDFRHVCAFFAGPEDEYRATVPFLKEGLERNERGLYIVDPEMRDESVRRLEDAGMNGGFEVTTWKETYLRRGHFDGLAMVDLIEELLVLGRERFGITRVVGQLGWAPRDPRTNSDLLEYETRLNVVLPRYPDPVICTYHVPKWGGGTVMDVMRTHPMVMIGGVLHENPFFVSPQQFLKELHERPATDRV